MIEHETMILGALTHLHLAIDDWAAQQHDAIHARANHLHRSIGQQFRYLGERLTRLPADHAKFQRFMAIGYTPPVTSTLLLTPAVGTAGGMLISAAASDFLKETLGNARMVSALEGAAR